MALGTYDMKIDQGSDFEIHIVWKDATKTPIDITDYTARMHVRKTLGTTGDPLIELTTENGRIVIVGAEGKVKLILSNTITAALPVELPKPGKVNPNAWPYDLELISPAGIVTRLLEGRVIPSPEVTR